MIKLISRLAQFYLFLLISLAIISSYGLNLLISNPVLAWAEQGSSSTKVWNGSFHKFDINDYPPLTSNQDTNREIAFYAYYAQDAVEECAALEQDHNLKMEKVSCSDFHESDYIRLNYLQYINALQNTENKYIREIDADDYLVTPITGAYNPGIKCVSKDAVKQAFETHPWAKYDDLLPTFGSNSCATFWMSTVNMLKTCGDSANQSEAEFRAEYLNSSGNFVAEREAKKLACEADCLESANTKACEIGGQSYTGYDQCSEAQAKSILAAAGVCCQRSSNSDIVLNPIGCNSCVQNPDNYKITTSAPDLTTCKTNCEASFNATRRPNNPNCYTLQNHLLPQFLSPDRTGKMVSSALSLRPQSWSAKGLTSPKWLPLSAEEKFALKYTDSLPIDTYNPEIKFSTGQIQSRCAGTGFSAIICILSRFLTDVTGGIYTVMETMLVIPPELLLSEDKAGPKPLFVAWSAFRNIANILFIGVLLFITLTHLTGYKKDQYKFRTILPRLIAAILLVNVSYYLVQVAVDISNILGSSLKQLFDTASRAILRKDVIPVGSVLNNIQFMLAGVVGVTLVGIVAFGAGLTVVIPILISTFVAGIITVFTLALRQLILIILIMATPVVFVSIILPNTKFIYDKWQKLFIALLMVYPLIAVMYGAGNFAFSIIQASNPDPIISLLSLSLIVMPLIAVPKLLSSSLKSLPAIGNKLAGVLTRSPQSASKKVSQTESMKIIARQEVRKQRLDKMGLSKPPLWNPIRRARSAINKNVTNQIPFYKNRRINDMPDEAVINDLDEAINRVELPQAAINVRNMTNLADLDVLDRDSNMPVQEIERKRNAIISSKGYDPSFEMGQMDELTIMASMVNTAKDAEGSLREFVKIINFAKTRTDIDPALLRHTMLKVQSTFNDEGRLEEYGLFKAYNNISGGTYDVTLKDYDDYFTLEQQYNLISSEMRKTSNFKSFLGYDNGLEINDFDPNSLEDKNYSRYVAKLFYEGSDKDSAVSQKIQPLFKNRKTYEEAVTGLIHDKSRDAIFDSTYNSVNKERGKEKGVNYINRLHAERATERSSTKTT